MNWMPLATWFTGNSSERWSASVAWVVAPSFSSTALVTPAASGVPMPTGTLYGAPAGAELIAGRAPL